MIEPAPDIEVKVVAPLFDSAAVARFYTGLSVRNARVGNGSWFGDESGVLRLGFGLARAAGAGCCPRRAYRDLASVSTERGLEILEGEPNSIYFVAPTGMCLRSALTRSGTCCAAASCRRCGEERTLPEPHSQSRIYERMF